jgi:hypothetical protein
MHLCSAVFTWMVPYFTSVEILISIVMHWAGFRGYCSSLLLYHIRISSMLSFYLRYRDRSFDSADEESLIDHGYRKSQTNRHNAKI